ncbi:MAG: ABC transporter permease [Oscillospiraceae bacterium]|nr:ABC transporter permease [Oscillospiraceae bacterium]
MNRCMAFAIRNLKELLRDPLSYIFCLGFPLIMLVVMSVVNSSIPEEAGMTIFRIDNLGPGIAVFGLSFVMLFTCLSVSKDRSGSFLVRLYASPMRSADFILGYLLPVFILAVAQSLITMLCALIVGLVTDIKLDILGALAVVPALVPLGIFFISTGLLFGTLFSEKASPGLCSIIISLSAFLGGVWFDVEGIDGVLADICNVLPFYHGTKAARAALALDFSGDFWISIAISAAYALVMTVLSILIFKKKMRADLS